MNARTFVAALAVAVLAAPAAAGAKVVPVKHRAHPARHVVKHTQVPRVLCICITAPVAPITPEAQAAWEQAYDLDLIAHGLDPVYGAVTADGATAGSTGDASAAG